ncbi:xyloside xylosyltransferase 1 [Macrosteles quadrilineatus]|uniref:xyloside xylosyltransferase 1 n=1 Tax=Macrosteles quadrilineatus TaxID=74068 RepID=UPI0023E096F6|nr:xyloside xylosyltransferase 1 [Macrosteles quadrilineatus]
MFYKILLNLLLLVTFLLILYVIQTNKQIDVFHKSYNEENAEILNVSTSVSSVLFATTRVKNVSVIDQYFNIWCIFTKVKNRSSSLKYKFSTLITSVLQHSSVKLSFHIISDAKSKYFAQILFDDIRISSKVHVDFKVRFYDVRNITLQLSKLTSSMLPYFTSQPGSYYSDALFFISLGLHQVAPESQNRAIMLDVDTKVVADIALLFHEFNRFGKRAVLGIAPELSPVYHHILYLYRNHHKHSRLGAPLSTGGFPGVNSGVLLLDFQRLRLSDEYNQLLNPDAVKQMVDKYSFKGHLGDQDFYTLVGFERPHLLHQLSCGWNHQLCEWWRDHGYRDVFDNFSHCSEPTLLYHGNCNTPIPQD